MISMDNRELIAALGRAGADPGRLIPLSKALSKSDHPRPWLRARLDQAVASVLDWGAVSQSDRETITGAVAELTDAMEPENDRTLTLRMPCVMHDAIAVRAEQAGVSKGQVVRDMIAAALRVE